MALRRFDRSRFQAGNGSFISNPLVGFGLQYGTSGSTVSKINSNICHIRCHMVTNMVGAGQLLSGTVVSGSYIPTYMSFVNNGGNTIANSGLPVWTQGAVGLICPSAGVYHISCNIGFTSGAFPANNTCIVGFYNASTAKYYPIAYGSQDISVPISITTYIPEGVQVYVYCAASVSGTAIPIYANFPDSYTPYTTVSICRVSDSS